MERTIICIDEALCDGCGLCVRGCPEGALQLIDGKARLVSELTCDGLGACIGECPRGAIRLETREAAPYDERAVLEAILPQGVNTLKAHLQHLHEHGQTTYLQQALAELRARGIEVPPYEASPKHHGCPGSAPRTFHPSSGGAVQREGLRSQLAQWPIQLHLIRPSNPVFQGADLLLVADCCAVALPDFNQRWLPGKRLALACPKLDRDQAIYQDKLVALIDEARINTLTVLIMDVPCCGGLLRLAQTALERAHRKIPIKAVVVGCQGDVLQEAWT